MNSTDEFVQLMDKPAKRLALRADLHWLQLTSAKDLWYLGGGAYDNKVFGLRGPSGKRRLLVGIGSRHQRRLAGDKERCAQFLLCLCQGKTVVAAIYPSDRNMQYGYVEFVYRWGLDQKGTVGQMSIVRYVMMPLANRRTLATMSRSLPFWPFLQAGSCEDLR